MVLAQFAEALGAETPSIAMRQACEALRQRVRAAGWTPGLDAYVRAFGLRVEEGPIPTAGRLDREGTGYVVRVQRTRHRGEAADPSGSPPSPPTPLRVADATIRQRFTIAHEIGHALLLECLKDEPVALASLRDPAAWAEIEALCDEAAGELLVPLADLLPLAGQLGVSLRGLERLADRFRVAQEVIQARLLAAGALNLSLWRVSALPRSGELHAHFERVLAQSPVRGGGWPGNWLPLSAGSVVLPDIVVEAARRGRAHATRVAVKGRSAHGEAAGIAMCHRPLGTHVEQPSLLDALRDDDGTDVPARAPDAPPTEAQVILLLLPLEAAATDAPLWSALTAR